MAYYFRTSIIPAEAVANVKSIIDTYEHFNGFCTLSAFDNGMDLSDEDRDKAHSFDFFMASKDHWLCYDLSGLGPDYHATLRDAIDYVKHWSGMNTDPFHAIVQVVNTHTNTDQQFYIWIGFDDEADKAKFVAHGQNVDIVI